MRHQCISTTVTFFLLLINKNNLTQTGLAHSRRLAYYFNWRDVFLDVATTSGEHADQANFYRNYAVRLLGPHLSYGKWQGTRYFYLFSNSGGPPQPGIVYQGHACGSKNGRDVRPTTHLHLVLMLTVSGAITSLHIYGFMTFTGTSVLFYGCVKLEVW
jgi:hypothetical protein